MLTGMARRLRIQYPGAIYHVMARGNGRQRIVRGPDDSERFLEGLSRSVARFDWRIYAFAILSNHFHLVLKTPVPNLAQGMQGLLSSYANAWARRHQFAGHVFQGRYRADLVENETYLWVVTRYVHLNPVRAGLVREPADWKDSSYPGYAHRRHRRDWVAYDELLAAWDGAFGGSDPATAYRRYVTAGVVKTPSSPWDEAHGGWILGGTRFLNRIRTLVRSDPARESRPERRWARAQELGLVIEAVCNHYGVDRAELSRRGSRHPARAALAYLARQATMATNAELVPVLGLSRPESVPNLTRLFAARLKISAPTRKAWTRLQRKLEAAGAGTP